MRTCSLLGRLRSRPAVCSAAAAAAVTAATVAVVSAHQPSARVAQAQQARQPITANRQLAPKHRVGLCGWPVKGARAANDPRVATLEKLFLYLKRAGYDGVPR